MIRAAAVVPVLNGRELLVKLLDSIAAQTTRFETVIVVDNGSTDGAPTLAGSRGCEVIFMGVNAGFAAAVNRGWQHAGTEWVAVLNSDVQLDPDWLSQCAQHADSSGFVTGMLVQANDPQVLDGAYDLVSKAGCAWRAGNGQPVSLSAEVRTIGIAPATACLYRRSLLAELNGFDESFESYYEDVDFGLRCVRAGRAGVYVPSARAAHRGSATFGRWNPKVIRLIARNQLLLVFRHYDHELFWQWLWPVVVGQLLWGLVAIRHGGLLAWLSGKREALGMRGRPPVPSARLRAFLERSEAEIRATAQDRYWRWYFRLTGA